MAAPLRDRTGEPLDTTSPPSYALLCLPCTAPDPEMRTLHHLRILKGHGLDVLHDHLFEQLVTLRESGKKREDAVEALMAWARNLVEQYQGMAHPTTGHKMPWWQARQWLMDNRDATAVSAYNQAPDAYKQRNPPAGNLQPVIARVTAHLPAEPGDDDPLAI